MKVLTIDTTNKEEITVALFSDNMEICKIIRPHSTNKSQEVLLLIDELLHKCNTSLYNITNINVNTGPGSFTGIRVGLSVANALSFLLKIPVNGQDIGKYEKAKYV